MWLVLLVIFDCSITLRSREVSDTLNNKSSQGPLSLIFQLTVTLAQLSTAVRFSIAGIPIKSYNIHSNLLIHFMVQIN